MTQSNLLVTCAVLAWIPLAGCQSAGQSAQHEASNADSINLAGLVTIDDLVREKGSDARLGDLPAELNYQRMGDIFKTGQERTLALRVYQLKPVPDAAEYPARRGRELGLHAVPFDPLAEHAQASDEPQESGDEPGGVGVVSQALTQTSNLHINDIVRTRDGDWELSMNLSSGAERLVDRKRFHTGAGKKTLPLDDQSYVNAARDYLQKKVMSEHPTVTTHSYKMRQYKNGSIETGSGGQPDVTTYQVAMAFNTDVDGIAVIGSGSKVSVHMDTEGNVISHEATVRDTAKSLATVSGANIYSPTKAREIVERRLADRGTDLSQYDLVSGQFGYLRRGRNSLQQVIAPAYAFIYAPKADVVSKKLVETVSAVYGLPVSAEVEKDAAGERGRKAKLQGPKADVRR